MQRSFAKLFASVPQPFAPQNSLAGMEWVAGAGSDLSDMLV
ncbi:hypothetical protein AB4111_01690 [Paenibacillus sp. 2KB_22]